MRQRQIDNKMNKLEIWTSVDDEESGFVEVGTFASGLYTRVVMEFGCNSNFINP
jgi:hypothetical protein